MRKRAARRHANSLLDHVPAAAERRLIMSGTLRNDSLEKSSLTEVGEGRGGREEGRGGGDHSSETISVGG